LFKGIPGTRVRGAEGGLLVIYVFAEKFVA